MKTQHFYDGTINLMQEKRVPVMIWSPLAGGEIFTSGDENAVELRKVLERLSKKYNCKSDTIIYAWHLSHPANLIPICGSGKIERLEAAVKACNIKLTREEWFEILVNGMGNDIP